MRIPFDNTYARLPERFFARLAPSPVRQPATIKINHGLAVLLGIDPVYLETRGALLFSGNEIPDGAEPIALAYAGHQFGGFVPQLGDGRAILLGEVVGCDGQRRDIQLKGSGRTPFSRGGDGRAALGPVLREYIVSEAMAALGIPTTRTLAAVETGEPVFREQPLPGAVLARVAASHLRIGTFQYFAARRDNEALEILTDYALRRHFPDAGRQFQSTSQKALGLLDCVIRVQAALVARWLGVGFVHGVMNTDNTAISGETIDYGPCAFLDEYHPSKKFSSIDHGGRYAFQNQPRIAQWNLARFAETLLPLIASESETAIRLATESLERFSEVFDSEYDVVLRAKLGLSHAQPGDSELIGELFSCLADEEIDFTVFFRALCSAAEDTAGDSRVVSLFRDLSRIGSWLAAWHDRQRVDTEPPATRVQAMRRANPAIIPRNHRIEQAIVAATGGDFTPFERLVRAVESPFEDREEFADLTEPPAPAERVCETFCGT